MLTCAAWTWDSRAATLPRKAAMSSHHWFFSACTCHQQCECEWAHRMAYMLTQLAADQVGYL